LLVVKSRAAQWPGNGKGWCYFKSRALINHKIKKGKLATSGRSSTPKKKNPWAPVVIVVILGITLLVVKTCNCNKGEPKTPTTTTTTNKTDTYDGRGLNRNPSNINYSKHARCRMDCRHIDESEVKEILREGKVNYNKSELNGADCKKKYAVEGLTHDKQKVRIIFAPCNTEVTVVTVIDIGEEWPCDCN
jgi:Domain of unknown function (DUF4258)